MRMNTVIGNIWYYGFAMVGGVAETTQVAQPTLDGGGMLQIVFAAILSAVAAAISKEAISHGMGWLKRNVTAENIKALIDKIKN